VKNRGLREASVSGRGNFRESTKGGGKASCSGGKGMFLMRERKRQRKINPRDRGCAIIEKMEKGTSSSLKKEKIKSLKKKNLRVKVLRERRSRGFSHKSTLRP